MKFKLPTIFLFISLQTVLTSKQNQMNILGIVTFLLIGGMAFWVLLFLLGFVLPFWITIGVFDKIRPKRVFDEEDKA